MLKSGIKIGKPVKSEFKAGVVCQAKWIIPNQKHAVSLMVKN